MAIIRCPECGKEVSNAAQTCPNCGFGVKAYFEREAALQKFEQEAWQEAYESVKQIKKAQAQKEEDRAWAIEAAKNIKIMIVIGLVVLVAVGAGNLISHQVAYHKAEVLLENQQYDDAIAAFRAYKGKKRTYPKIQEAKYLKAKSLVDKKDYNAAYALFEELGDYEDAQAQLTNLKKQHSYLNVYDCKVCDEIEIGEFEQDNNSKNGKEPIKWKVHKVEDGAAYLVSEKCLYSMADDGDKPEKWLEDEIYGKCFTEAEKEVILPAEWEVERRGYFPIKGEKSGKHVYLPDFENLDIDDKRSLNLDYEAKAKATPYAVKHGGPKPNQFNNVNWLLANGMIGSGGSIYSGGSYFLRIKAEKIRAYLRPAMWVKCRTTEY